MLEGPLAANEDAAVTAYAGPKGVPTDDLAMCAGIQLDYYQKFQNAYSSGWSCSQPAIMAADYALQQPWGTLSQKTWEQGFKRYSSARPNT